MQRRLQFHDELVGILGTDNVYFQPPENVKLKFPCIIYSKSQPNTDYADNDIYTFIQKYDLMVIYDDPDSDLSRRLIFHFKYARLDRTYTAENLYHDSITIFY